MRKAKIICTMGPASREEPTLSKLVDAGISARDTASLLRLSRPRVYQLLGLEANEQRGGSARPTHPPVISARLT